MEEEILKLKRTIQGARIKAFEKKWLAHLGFSDAERNGAEDLQITLTFLPDGKIVMSRRQTEPPTPVSETEKKEVPPCQ